MLIFLAPNISQYIFTIAKVGFKIITLSPFETKSSKQFFIAPSIPAVMTNWFVFSLWSFAKDLYKVQTSG